MGEPTLNHLFLCIFWPSHFTGKRKKLGMTPLGKNFASFFLLELHAYNGNSLPYTQSPGLDLNLLLT